MRLFRGMGLLPEDASLDGYRVDALLHYAHGVDAVLLGLVVLGVVYACVRFGPQGIAAGFTGETRAARLTVLGIAVAAFLLLDGRLFAGTIADLDEAFWNFKKVEADPRTVRIEVNAQQWSWSARYAGPDGEFNTADDLVTLNDLRIPEGRPVMVQLGSADVIHAFSLPNFRVKADAIPGRIGRLWFQAKKTGVFEIVCAQHCGVGHYKMRGVLTVLPGDAYDAWAREGSAISARGYDVKDEAAHWGWAWR